MAASVRKTRRRTRTTGAESASLESHALQQARTLLRRLAFQVSETARRGDADSVHDLRVAIRRFTQCLRIFEQCFPKAESRKIRHRLKAIMGLAAAVRDRDITMDLLKAAGCPKRTNALGTLKKDRERAEQELLQTIRRSGRDNFSAKWRVKLEL